jgi:hypothetical protein
METQTEYEADILLAVFSSDRAAAEAVSALHGAGIQSSQSSLAPGRYQLADVRLRRRFGAGVVAAIVGAIIGAIIGILLEVWLVGRGYDILFWFGVAGAAGGAVIGPLFGIARESKYDDDVARFTQIDPGHTATLVRAQAEVGTLNHARHILARCGAEEFLDVPAYDSAQEPGLTDQNRRRPAA